MPYELDDAASFEANLASFGEELKQLDSKLGPVLLLHINDLATPTARADVLDALLDALNEGEPE